MLRLRGRNQSTCEGLSRRELVQAGGAGLFGLSLPKLLSAEAQKPSQRATAKNVIFLFLFGGPSQLETFDMKPDAPAAIRGPFQSIASRTPGLRICEHLPRTAGLSDRLSIIRTMSHPYNDHSGGGHYIQTGHRWPIPIGGGFNATPDDWPSIGSVFNYTTAQQAALPETDLPTYMVVPNSLGRIQTYSVQLVRPGEYAGWLGRGWDPITTAIDKRDSKDNPYFRDCTDDELQFQLQGMASPETLTLNRLSRRRSLLEQFDSERDRIDRNQSTSVYDKFREQALGLVTSEKTRIALDIRQEPDALRDRYGRNLFGQSTLMARRLIEAGSRFVTVHWDCPDGYSWDSHTHSNDVKNHLIPGLDNALASLIEDLSDRGMLDETLVVCLGEMGRTPQANGNWGRNHWSTLFPAVLAGAGVQGGMLFGESDKDAAYAVTPPVSPEDLAATIYHALGIDPEMRIPDRQNRPVPLIENGRVLTELFG
ncbi:MAG TPA: DUF1501 domain-containing protein [Planctomycetaceae bacterium]|nr:DUF1501 domain-containing protein [Planctomycetaceae bacterium]